MRAGARVDRALQAGDVRLSMGGEPTFVSASDMEAEEWTTEALGPTKRRMAGRLLRRVRDFAAAEGASRIDRACAARGLARLEVDEAGLDSLDRRYLRALIDNYAGGPAGVETLAYAIAEARDAVEDVIEPFLMQQGFIQRTPRGRLACAKAYAHLGLSPPTAPATQAGLFDEPADD